VSSEPAPDARITFARPDLADQQLQGRVAAQRYATPERSRIAVACADLFLSPEPGARLATQLLFGEAVSVLERTGGKAWVQNRTDHYVGYIDTAALTPAPSAPAEAPPEAPAQAHAEHRVHVPRTLAFAEPDIKAPLPRALSLDSRLRCLGPSQNRLTLTDAGWVPSAHLAPLSARHDPVQTASALLHTPYLWGGRSASGLDCSALVQLCFAATGLGLPRDSDQQLAWCRNHAQAVAQDQAARGDIAFFPGHVGIMVDGRQLIHANATAMAVSIDPLDHVIAIVAREIAADTPAFLGLFRLAPSAHSRD